MFSVLTYLADTTPPAAPAETSYVTRVLSSILWSILGERRSAMLSFTSVKLQNRKRVIQQRGTSPGRQKLFCSTEPFSLVAESPPDRRAQQDTASSPEHMKNMAENLRNPVDKNQNTSFFRSWFYDQSWLTAVLWIPVKKKKVSYCLIVGILWSILIHIWTRRSTFQNMFFKVLKKIFETFCIKGAIIACGLLLLNIHCIFSQKIP